LKISRYLVALVPLSSRNSEKTKAEDLHAAVPAWAWYRRLPNKCFVQLCWGSAWNWR